MTLQQNRSTVRHASPLRYPGGKGKIANYLKLLLIENSLIGARYVEPYAGGASVALSLLFEGYIGHAHINDLNRGIYSFWRLVLDEPERLCSKISSVPLTIDEWNRQRKIYSNPDADPFDFGFASFFLNRTNRSGIISGGVIGGLEQAGDWKMDARFNRESLCNRIGNIAEHRSRISLSMLDAVDLIQAERQRRQQEQEQLTFIYLDPPYYVKGSRLYDNFYAHADHMRVCQEIRKMPGPWVVSYDAEPEILKMYEDENVLTYSLGYSANRASQGTEVMFFSSDLSTPDVDSPSGISASTVKKFKARNGAQLML